VHASDHLAHFTNLVDVSGQVVLSVGSQRMHLNAFREMELEAEVAVRSILAVS
jgi:hypothetical protein